jgi:hypothetical protein
MSRLRRIAEYERFFFITTNLSRNVPLLRPAEMDMLLEILESIRGGADVLLIGYVIMPDHCHILFKHVGNLFPTSCINGNPKLATLFSAIATTPAHSGNPVFLTSFAEGFETFLKRCVTFTRIQSLRISCPVPKTGSGRARLSI